MENVKRRSDFSFGCKRMYQLLQKKFDNAQEFNARLRASNLSPELSEAYEGYASSLDNVILEEAKALVAAAES